MNSRKPIYALLVVGTAAALTLAFVPYSLERLSEAGRRVVNVVTPATAPAPEDVPAPPPPPPSFDAAAWLMAREEAPEKHGVLIESLDGRRVLASHNADTPYNPASLIKLATTLAALKRLGPDFRYETRVYTTGTLGDDGTLRGRVHVAGHDPSFGDSAAALIARELKARGVRDATEGVTVSPDFSLNFNPSPEDSAKRLVEMMQFGRAESAVGKKVKEAAGKKRGAEKKEARREEQPTSARAAKRKGQGEEVQPEPEQEGALTDRRAGDKAKAEQSPLVAAQPPAERHLFVLRSNPLREILLYMNAHSNNFVAERIGNEVGGPAAVQSLLAGELKLSGPEFALSTTSGLEYNRMTPRAVVGVVRALHAEAQRRGLKLEDVMPVVSSDRGTLRHRLDDTPLKGAAVGKTGTLARDDGGMASLAGVVYTQNGGLILFAMLDQGHEVWQNRQLEEQLLAEVITASNEQPAALTVETPRQLLSPSELLIENAGG